jgi:transcriptional regulator with XRE-family HTH domain
MINVRQIRAARGLLDWSQAELAKASGLSLPAITKIERGTGHPRQDSLQAIRAAFENNGVEFLDTPGVQMRSEKFHSETFFGADSVLRVWEDIEKTFATGNGGELLLSGVDERIWLKFYSEPLKLFQKKMAQLNVSPRLLIRAGDSLITAPPSCYRAVPEWIFAQTPYYIYHDKMAIIHWGPPQRIILIQSKNIAETFRQQFEYNWLHGKELKLSG